MQDYWVKIAEAVQRFSRAGDDIRCVSVFREEGRTCELCGYTPITWNHVLQNMRTDRSLTVGKECVHNIHVAARKLSAQVKILYPAKYSRAAELINREHPGTVTVVPFIDVETPEYNSTEFEREFNVDYLVLDEVDRDVDDLAPDGMGSDEIDYESLDYEARD